MDKSLRWDYECCHFKSCPKLTMKQERKVWLRWKKKNSYSIAALMALVDAQLTSEPQPGIMLYSFATAQAAEVYREVHAAREMAVYVAGGPHPSALPEEALQYFDYVVIGEAEETLPELIHAILEGHPADNVRGIAYKRDGETICTAERPAVDLDRYPPFTGRVLAPIEISRGCPWSCAFCQTPRLFGSRMRHRSIDVIARFTRCHKDVRFTSPNSLAYGSDGIRPRLDKVEALLRRLVETKKPIYFGTFPSEVRPEFVSHQALGLIASYCANRTLCIGAQSGSPAVLKAIGRGHGVEHVKEACDLCREWGLVPRVDLIFGLPMESREDQLLTLELAEWIAAKGGKVRAHLFTPLPGTPLAGARPAPVHEVASELGRLALEGKLTGSWAARGRTS
jgi:B12-binding domain/radical SAM domain protein